MDQIATITTYGPLVVGTMLVGSGLYGVVRPLDMIRYFGLPWAGESHSKIYPAVGVRNFSAGVATLGLSLSGRTDSVGILLASWVAVGAVDSFVVIKDPRGTQRAVHAINTVVLSFFSALILLEKTQEKWVKTSVLTGFYAGLAAMFCNSWILS